MRSNTKSSITLPAEEVRVVERLQRRLGARTKVEVIRRALDHLLESVDRAELRRAYREASRATRTATLREVEELDHLAAEGLDE
jgi:hypothetical protein